MQHEQPHRLVAASDAAIRVQNLGKKYRIRHRQPSRYSTLREAITDGARAAMRRTPPAMPAVEDFWALRDVSFEVARGEVVGIIGRNGAGKSTLLKVLSRITEPSEGRVELDGRLASLLEVGTGFHPELTGRENIFLNGVILGMSRAEVRRKFDEIVTFGEVEKFLDTPVKRYSSGMYLRLAFAVAAHIDPDILLVDEILSVGDAAFQKKCLGKMGDMTRAGRTVLLVSHNMGAVGGLCSRCLVVRDGAIICDDRPAAAIAHYMASLGSGTGGELRLSQPEGKPPLYVMRMALTAGGEPATRVEMGGDAVLEVDYVVEQPINTSDLALLLSRDGMPFLYSLDTDADDLLILRREPGRYRARIALPLAQFKQGEYSVEIRASWNWVGVTDARAVLAFEIVNETRDLTNKGYRADRPGHFAIDLNWNTVRLP